MRRFNRPELPPDVSDALDGKQTEVNTSHAVGKLDHTSKWKSARQTQPLLHVLSTLQQMTGVRRRCMYCGDSHGTDIEHFWPKAAYPQRMFLWPNLLLGCTDCGRIKGDQFPLRNGRALLIDPALDDPWRYLDFDPATGNIVARFDDATNQQDLMGETTVTVLQLDRREALAAGHQKTYRRIQTHVTAFINGGIPSADELIAKLLDDDEYGLLGWCFRGAGMDETPFRDLRTRNPAAWDQCLRAVAQR